MAAGAASGPRSIAIVGPYLSGKTTLLESILFVAGAIGRKGKVGEGNSVGDNSQEARGREMGVEVNVASTEYMGDRFTFLDCPGSIEFSQESFSALVGVDAAVVVCEADPTRALSVAPILRFLDEHKIPRIIFVNKLDRATATVGDMVDALQTASSTPLVLRHIPIIDGEEATGYVDLASERAYAYKPDAASEVVEVPAAMTDSKSEARYQMLETLSDYDDDLMEKLLEEKEPQSEQVYDDLTTAFRDAVIAPVFLGVAEREHGVRRLLKALRHEVAGAEASAARARVEPAGDMLAQVLKTYHTVSFGKLSVLRVWRGVLKDGATLNGERVSGLFRMVGQQTDKIAEAEAGEIVAAGRLDEAQTGDTLSTSKESDALPRTAVLPPVYALAIKTSRREDDVKLSGALTKICEEDPSLQIEHSQDTNELILRGQGEIHLRVACDRLNNRYKIAVETSRPSVPYKEAIKKSVSQHARFKRQSGGHGQFGDVEVDIKPLPRGSGFSFDNTVVGGSVPRQYIPAVEAGVNEYLAKGPLGFPVVDVSVTLTDGSYHAVDSSELAFKTAGRKAMTEGMPKCGPILLEPILEVRITVPSESTAKVNGLVSSRRGQILGFETQEGGNWDEITVQLPQSEVHDLIVELRSLSMGVGTYTWKFDHLQELGGRLAADVVAANNAVE